jgi:hypothetical protein
MAGSGFTSELRFAVRDWFAWTPGRETRPDWRTWARGMGSDVSGEDAAAMPTVPMMLRRRATPIGQKVMGAALACRDIGGARYVVASRHGEYDRTVGIFTSLAAREAPSPAEFSMSVHNGLAGLLSIHTGNKLGHVAIAAGEDSFAYGLIEAGLCLAEEPETPVLLLYYDAPLPAGYEPFRNPSEAELPVIVALVLENARGAAISCSWMPAAPAVEVRGNQAVAFMRWLLSGAPDGRCAGERMTWRWSHVH